VNPGWRNGDELACIARMTFSMPFKYALKKALKLIPKFDFLSKSEKAVAKLRSTKS
jgi:hypothetical protein